MYKKKILDSQKSLKIIDKTSNELLTKAKFGPSKLTRIPFCLDEELAFFVGAIIGDGHLRKDKFQTTIELSDKDLLAYLKIICQNLFDREFNIKNVKIREGRKPTFNMCMDSKSIFHFLEEVFEIPRGRKSHIVKVPIFIFNSNKKIKLAFLKGVMATEGGRRRRGFGLSTASEQLWIGLQDLFLEVGIPILKDRWVYKIYEKEYYGIAFKEKYFNLVRWECRSGQTGRP